MAKVGKKDMPFQWDLSNEEDWEELLQKPGLWVVDVYRDWSGPCNCMQSTLKKIKNELEDDMLEFATAPCDRISHLASFRETCEPQWLIVAGGEFVAFMKGTNVTELQKLIEDQLKQEKMVLEGQTERKPISNIRMLTKPIKSMLDIDVKRARDEQEGARSLNAIRAITKAKLTAKELVNREFTLALVKPDAVLTGKLPLILHDIKIAAIEVLHQKQRILTEDEVKELYKMQKNMPHFPVLLRYMMSGPCAILILAKAAKMRRVNIVAEWKELIGPATVETAKRVAPDSLRAKYGVEGFHNAVHGSQSEAQAQKEFVTFFPAIAEYLAHPDHLNLEQPAQFIEFALMIVRPHVFNKYKKEMILRTLEREHLQIIAQKMITFTHAQVKEIFPTGNPKIIESMLMGPSMVLVLSSIGLYEHLQDIIGPENVHEAKKKHPRSLRALFAHDEPLALPSAFHVSERMENALHEINVVFPNLALELQQLTDIEDNKKSKVDVTRSYAKLKPQQQVVLAIMPRTIKNHDVEEIIQKIRDGRFSVTAQKLLTMTADQATQFLKSYADLFLYNKIFKAIISGPSLLLCIPAAKGVKRLHQLLGPMDVNMATKEAPNSLRGLYHNDGEDISPFYVAESDTNLNANMFFPEVATTASQMSISNFPQYSVIIISPHILKKFSEESIFQMFDDDDLPVVNEKRLKLSFAMIEQMFFIHRMDLTFDRTARIFQSGKSLIIAVYATDAIRTVNDSLANGRLVTLMINDRDALHVRASLDMTAARNEMETFFPKETVLAILKPDAYLLHKDKILQMITNVGLTIIGQCLETLTEEQVRLMYSSKEKEQFFEDLIIYMTSGKSLMLALYGYGAIKTWRSLMGPVDPDVARKEAPKSIRALFGKNVLQNVVHGSEHVNIFEHKLNIVRIMPRQLSVTA